MGQLFAIILLLIILLCFFSYKSQESFEDIVSEPISDDPFVRLYGDFRATDLKFEFAPYVDHKNKLGNGYMKKIIPVDLKSYEINLPKTGISKYDAIRRVNIWEMYPDDVLASSLAPAQVFISAYKDPKWAYKANTPRYRFVDSVRPGQYVKKTVKNPVKRILLVAVL